MENNNIPQATGEIKEFSFGEKAVGLTFNPSNDPQVQEVKELYAKIIDIIQTSYPIYEEEEKARISLEAIRQAQTAQMWAVKAITYKN